MKLFGHFSVSSKCVEVLNEPFNFLEMEGDSLLKHVPSRWLLQGLAIDKMLKY